ncbi:RRAGC [Symbiodinium sp. KB8]|nr:RRAGC [Symbiodinium sp. KB8]
MQWHWLLLSLGAAEQLRGCLQRVLDAGWNVTPCWPSPWGPYAAGQVGAAPEHPSWSDGLDVYDTDGQHVGTSTAWQAQTSCQWHRTVYVIPRLPDGRILFQRRAAWKWRMGGLWDLGASETVEMGEDLQAAAQRAVHEELGSRAALLALTECCRLNTGWSGALPKMQLCQLDQNIVYTAKGSLGADAGDRDEEVDALEYWSLDDYTMQAELDRYKFAPWVHALIVGCPRKKSCEGRVKSYTDGCGRRWAERFVLRSGSLTKMPLSEVSRRVNAAFSLARVLMASDPLDQELGQLLLSLRSADGPQRNAAEAALEGVRLKPGFATRLAVWAVQDHGSQDAVPLRQMALTILRKLTQRQWSELSAQDQEALRTALLSGLGEKNSSLQGLLFACIANVQAAGPWPALQAQLSAGILQGNGEQVVVSESRQVVKSLSHLQAQGPIAAAGFGRGICTGAAAKLYSGTRIERHIAAGLRLGRGCSGCGAIGSSCLADRVWQALRRQRKHEARTALLEELCKAHPATLACHPLDWQLSRNMSSEDVGKVVMCGLPRCGKTSISKVVFQKLSPHESLFLESGIKLETFTIVHNSLLRLKLVDFPGNLLLDDSLSLHPLDASVFSGQCAVVLVIDAQQEEAYTTSVTKARRVIEFACKRNPDVTFDVLMHKVDGAKFYTDGRKEECKKAIEDKLTEDMSDKEKASISFHCTSIYDHTVFEAFSQVVQKLILERPTLEKCLEAVSQNTRMEKVYLFDVVSKLYLAADKSNSELSWYELCADMVDVVIDIACIYGNGLEDNKDAGCEFQLHNGAVLVLKEVGHCLALVCVFQGDDACFDRQELLEHNVEVFKEESYMNLNYRWRSSQKATRATRGHDSWEASVRVRCAFTALQAVTSLCRFPELEVTMSESIEGLLRPACLLVQSLHPAYEQAVIQADDGGQSEEEGGVAPLVAQTMELIQAMAVRVKLKPLLKNRLKNLLQLLVPFMRITENQAASWRADPNEFLVQEEDEHCRGCAIRVSGEGLVGQMLDSFKREASRAVAALATDLLERGEAGRSSGDAAAWKLTEVGLFVFSIAVGEATVKSLQRSELGPLVPDTLQLAARLCADRNASEFLRARAFSHLHRLGDIVTQMVREEIPHLLEAAAKSLGPDEPLVVRVSACRVFCRFLTAMHDDKLREELLLKKGVLSSLGSLLREADEELLHLCLECLCIIVKQCPTIMAAVSHELCPLTVQIWRRCAADPMVHMQVLDLVSCCVSADPKLQSSMEESLLPVVANDLQPGSDPHLASSAIELLGVLLKRAAVPFGAAMCSCVAPLVVKAMESDESMMLQNSCETLVSLVERSPSQVMEAGLLEPLLRLVERLLGPDLEDDACLYVGRSRPPKPRRSMAALRLLTFNIWFAAHEMKSRMEAIGKIIDQKSPDLIALQEMTAEHWQECLQSEPFRRYFWSPAPRQRYFTMLGSRLPIKQEPVRHPFKASRMQRDLLMLTVEPPELPPLTFATSHLESLDEHKARRVQIDESLSHLADYQDAVFCGDTNINEAIDGNVKLPGEWEDAWLVLKPDDPGYTFDVERNRPELVCLFFESQISCVTPGSCCQHTADPLRFPIHRGMMAASDGWARANTARLRFDRFWTKMTNYAATDIELLDEPIKEGLWPSDHFGLLLTLQEWRRNRGDLKSDSCTAA